VTSSHGPTEPPLAVKELRRELEAVCAEYGSLVAVEHSFAAAEGYDPDSAAWPADHGWTTELHPTAHGVPVQVYFDGVDEDLQVRVGEPDRSIGLFEWSADELSDISRTGPEVARVVGGVLAGDVWEWRTDRERGCEVRDRTGRLWRAGDGRPPSAQVPPRREHPASQRRLPGYRPAG
jgi:hypothetical protein